VESGGMSIWKKVRAGVSTVMPVAAKVLGTAHPLAGMAVEFLAGALDVDAEGKSRRALEREVAARMEAPTASDLAAIQKANNEFELAIAQLGYDEQRLDVELAELEMADRQNARALAGQTGIWPQFTLAVTLTLMVFGLAGLLVWMLTAEFETKPEVLALVSTLFGAVLSEWRGCLAFFNGTTHGSSRKTDAMAAKAR
jgi:hypothetical protein